LLLRRGDDLTDALIAVRPRSIECNFYANAEQRQGDENKSYAYQPQTVLLNYYRQDAPDT